MSCKSFEDLVHDVPRHVLQQPCTEIDVNCKEVLLHVSQNTSLTPSMLGRWLFLQENEIQAIQFDNHWQPSCEIVYLVLLKWINNNGTDATYEKLLKAIYSGRDRPTFDSILNIICPASAVRRVEVVTEKNRISVDEMKGVKILPMTNGTPLSEHSPRTPSTPNISSFSESVQETRRTPTSLKEEESTESHTPYPSHSGVPTMCPTCPSGTPFNTPNNFNSSIPPSPSVSSPDSAAVSRQCPFVNNRPDSLTIPRNFKLNRTNNLDMVSPFDNMPKCANAIGQLLQQRMNRAILEHKEKAKAASLKHLQAQEQLQSLAHVNQIQKEELAMNAARMRVVINQADEIHSENFNLKQELELNQQLLGIVCGALELWKDEVKTEKILTPIQQQIDSMIQSLSSSVPDSLKVIQRDYQKLLVVRDDLEKELNAFYSLYADKQTQLKAIMEENKRLEAKSGSQAIEISQLKRKVCELMGQCKKMKEKNKELEKKVAVLELEKEKLTSKCNKLEKNQIVVVLSKHAHTDLTTPGLMRSYSDGTYIEQQQRQQHQQQQQHHVFKKHFSEDFNTNTSDKCLLESLEDSLKEEIEDECDEQCTYSLEWTESVTEMVTKCDSRNSMLVQSVDDIKTQLNNLKLSQKIQQYF